ncbi:hypothetical protein RAB70_04120 [Xanthomonas sontii]|uniref:hypothetical protein n=1 Tax=Xanthomonas sontii TaxID=2650745 RepID=UPI0011E72FDD|nr:hypothetical protein [Xanthomonas sontii]MDQ7757825.1 hypothetical protein [Xanthomonas sontii]UZK05444.1 hypothetical protein CJ027_000910 [Xanthomonas sontii]
MDRQPPAGDDPGCGLSDAARLLQRSVSSAATTTAILARLGDATFDRIAEPLRSAFAESRSRLERPASSHVASACAGLGMDLVERYRLATAAAGSDRLHQRHHHRAGSVAGI